MGLNSRVILSLMTEQTVRQRHTALEKVVCTSPTGFSNFLVVITDPLLNDCNALLPIYLATDLICFHVGIITHTYSFTVPSKAILAANLMLSKRAFLSWASNGDITAAIRPASIMRGRSMSTTWIHMCGISDGKVKRYHPSWRFPVCQDPILGTSLWYGQGDLNNFLRDIPDAMSSLKKASSLPALSIARRQSLNEPRLHD